MQAIKEKLSDMSAMRRAKAEAKEEEKAEKELAKARMEVAHEVRLAREAEAKMDLHVSKAAEKAEREIAKHEDLCASYPTVVSSIAATDNPHGGNAQPPSAAASQPYCIANTAGVPPPSNAF